MKYIYRLNEITVKTEEETDFIVYGIDAVDKYGNILSSYTDIFFDRTKAEKFVALCNDCKLELIHLPDAVEDAIAEQYAIFC